MSFGEENRYQNFIDIILATVRWVNHEKYRTIKIVYDRTNSRIIEGTQMQRSGHKWRKYSTKVTWTPENATDDFVTVKTTDSEVDLIMDFETIEDPGSLNYFNPRSRYFPDNKTLCDWRDHIININEPLFLRISDYKDRDCSCMACKFLKAYIEMISEDDY